MTQESPHASQDESSSNTNPCTNFSARMCEKLPADPQLARTKACLVLYSYTYLLFFLVGLEDKQRQAN